MNHKPRHRGRFKWRKYSKYRGNLKDYWTNERRTTHRHRAENTRRSVRFRECEMTDSGNHVVPLPPEQVNYTNKIRDRINTILATHYPQTTGYYDELTNWCQCGMPRDHVADVLIRELGLRQDTYQLLTRYVTQWERNG